jgi:pimeloyl-ACP methyl ester carboxylesterase
MRIVLLPGLHGTDDLFAEFVAAAPVDATVDMVSYPTEEPMSYADHVEFARQRLPATGPYVVLGESFSGPVSVLLADSRPIGLCGIILVNTFITSPAWSGLQRLPWERLMARRLTKLTAAHYLTGRRHASHFLEPIREASLRSSPQVKAARLRAVLSVDVREAFKRLGVPVLYLRGSKDRLVRKRSLATVKAVRPGTEVVLLPGPHLVLQVLPHESWQAICRFTESACSG